MLLGAMVVRGVGGVSVLYMKFQNKLTEKICVESH